MRKWIWIVLSLSVALGCATSQETPQEASAPSNPEPAAEADWISLFDGVSLEGWTASENVDSFSVQDGKIVVDGPRSHLFYTGPVGEHNFKDFEFKAEVMTTAGSNSGMYFHTRFQEEGWPARGYEVQVNNSHTDVRRTGSLYAIQDVHEVKAKDDVWFTQHISVQGKRIVVQVDGETVVDYTEPDNPERPDDMKERLLTSGTFALQGHDPKSRVFYKNIAVRPM